MLQQKNQYTNVTGAQSGTINSRDGQVSRKEAGEDNSNEEPEANQPQSSTSNPFPAHRKRHPDWTRGTLEEAWSPLKET